IVNQRRRSHGDRFHSSRRCMIILWRTLNRIVLGLPNLCCRRRCILLSLRAPAERGGEQLCWNDDDVTWASGESLRGIRFADRRIVRAVAGEPFGDVPERLPFDAAPSGDDVAPAGVSHAVE